MSKTPFSNKCDILSALWMFYRDEASKNEAWQQFFDYNDVGLPMAYGISEGLVAPGKDGEVEQMIDETWVMLCNYIDVDFDGKYETIDDLFTASPMPPLEQNDE